MPIGYQMIRQSRQKVIEIFRENAWCPLGPQTLPRPPDMDMTFWESIGPSGTVISPKKDPGPAPQAKMVNNKTLKR